MPEYTVDAYTSVEDIARSIVKDGKGIYRWAYNVNMLRNTDVLLGRLNLPLALFGILALGAGIAVHILPVHEFLRWVVGHIAGLGVLVIVLPLGALLFLGLWANGAASMLFEMGGDTIARANLRGAKGVADIAAALTGKPSLMSEGVGIVKATRVALPYRKIRKITLLPHRDLIQLHGGGKTMGVFVRREDYEFVRETIVANCRGNKRLKIVDKWHSMN